MKEYYKLYLEFARIKLKTQMESRLSFFMLISCKIVLFGANGIMLWVMINKFEIINGWNSYEILLLFALEMITYSFAGCLFYDFFVLLPKRIRNGELDEVLIKPLNPTIYLMCRGVSAGYLANVTVGIIAFVVASINLNIIFDFKNIMMLIILIIGGVLIQCAIFSFSYTPSFWMIKNNAIREVISETKGFTKYPISIYGKGIQFILTFLMPFAFINFYPAQYFLNKTDGIYFSSIMGILTIGVGALVAFLGYKFWKLGLKNYQSTGS